MLMTYLFNYLHKAILFTFVVSIFLTTQAADDTAPIEIQEKFTDKDWLPHMLDHFHKGCPTNSYCEKDTGLKFDKWNQFMAKKPSIYSLEKFRSQHFFPIEVYSFGDVLKESNLVSWNSHCSNHQKKDPIHLSIVLAKDFQNLKNSFSKVQNIMTRKVLLLDDKKITVYEIPRDDYPKYLENKALKILKSHNDFYYGLSIESSGKVTITEPPLRDVKGFQIDCPKELEKEWEKLNHNKDLYQGTYCKTIMDFSTKKNQIMLLGWSCV